MGMPDGNPLRQVSKNSLPIRFDLKKAPLAFRPFIPIARLDSSHQPDRSSKSQGHLLVATADTKNRLTGFTNYRKDSGKGGRGVAFPGMTLSAENDVGRIQTPDP